MSTLRILLPFLAALAVAPGCSGDDLSVGGEGDGSLEREDVEDIPAGDASGADVSGAYLFTSSDQRSCSCSAGDQALFCDSTLAVEGIVLTQDDGALELRELDLSMSGAEVVLTGGIDADGTLVVGGINTVTDASGTPIGDTINRVEGTIVAGDGGSLAWSFRSRAVLEGESIDCSMTFDLGVSWWDPDTLGACGNDDDCHPERPYCVDDVCSDGAVGATCVFDNDCVTDICLDDVCSGGAEGDPCTFPSECASGVCTDGACDSEGACEPGGCGSDMICFDGACQAGAEGDPCEQPSHCAPGSACVGGTCYDGSAGDPCDSPIDCNAEHQICFQDQCQAGSEGDACESTLQCSVDAPRCVEGSCYDGSPGDPCTSDPDCESLSCPASGLCD